jgi:hypothetical protein
MYVSQMTSHRAGMKGTARVFDVKVRRARQTAKLARGAAARPRLIREANAAELSRARLSSALLKHRKSGKPALR